MRIIQNICKREKEDFVSFNIAIWYHCIEWVRRFELRGHDSRGVRQLNFFLSCSEDFAADDKSIFVPTFQLFTAIASGIVWRDNKMNKNKAENTA